MLLDSHLDTWPAYRYPQGAHINHGTFFAVAQGEGLVTNTSIHAGIRCKMAVGHSFTVKDKC